MYFHRHAAACVTLAMCFLNTEHAQDNVLQKQYALTPNSPPTSFTNQIIPLDCLISTVITNTQWCWGRGRVRGRGQGNDAWNAEHPYSYSYSWERNSALWEQSSPQHLQEWASCCTALMCQDNRMKAQNSSLVHLPGYGKGNVKQLTHKTNTDWLLKELI